MLLLRIVAFVCAIKCTIGLRYIKVVNNNNFPIWIESFSNNGQPPLRNNEAVLINPSQAEIFNIEDSGWAGRLWAKFGCDGDGTNCEIGQSVAPCPSNGCQPPSDTKVEFFFPPIGDPKDAYYDISLVDGYSLASEIIPYQNNQPFQNGACARTNCQLQLNSCPTNEISGLADLTVKGKNNNIVSCLAPCKKWNYPAPYGNARNEQEGDGRMLCCPEGVLPEDCRKGLVTQTEYVKLLRNTCPSAYSYSYDDEGGLHNCPSDTSYVVNFYSTPGASGVGSVPHEVSCISAGKLQTPIGKLLSFLPQKASGGASKAGSVKPPKKASDGASKKAGSVSSAPKKTTGSTRLYPDESYYVDEPYLFGMLSKKKLMKPNDHVVMAALPFTDPTTAIESHKKGSKAMVGFAAVAKTTGGQAGKMIQINNLADLIKYVNDSVPRVLMINKDIKAPKLTKVLMGSDKTIIGSPKNVRLYNIYLSATKKSKNIIFQNLIFEHSPINNGNDDIQLYLNYGKGYWIDHCSFVGHAWSLDDGSNDKLLYIGEKASHATISNCFFGNHKYGPTFGYLEDNLKVQGNADTHVTIYDNHFENVEIGAPGQMRYGHYHVYNNYINNCQVGFKVSKNAVVVSEYNYFSVNTKNNGNGMLDDRKDGKFSDTGSVPTIHQKCPKSNWRASSAYKYKAVERANPGKFPLDKFQPTEELGIYGYGRPTQGSTLPLPSMQYPAMVSPSAQSLNLPSSPSLH
ncbi:uncharacterized protein LOC116348351 [Contarinia nasturtii]|uniref:uncharacterized protein LOC116348351 n=1 Tax=Contarinia nasturtii TaxID=265458 RepID=UPI0012D38F8D|nr:uncharacterized protein LOC116348351 [Contarinia nasturtii]